MNLSGLPTVYSVFDYTTGQFDYWQPSTQPTLPASGHMRPTRGEIAEALRVMKWGTLLKGQVDELAQEEAEALAEIAASFEVGDVLEKRGIGVFQKRR